ncbi:MAG: TrkA family potassium uptake protein [Clostridiales bacterium]|jgi:trk system potassium uptake protein TrkA|nr:TrkA family potassium uptake protein [Clostridiales bacterium]
MFYINGKKSNQNQIPKPTKRSNLTIVVGSGRLGASISAFLSDQGKDVTVIDVDEKSFRKLSPDYSGFAMAADATDVNVLEKAGIKTARALVAVTNYDNVNIMISQIAKAIYDVPIVVSRIYDDTKEVINQDYDIKTIYPTKLCMSSFEEIFANN